MLLTIKGAINTAYKAYPPIAMGICAQELVSEGHKLYSKSSSQRPKQEQIQGQIQEQIHNIFNLTLALGSLAAIYFSPLTSDFLNGSYYVSRYQADFYESNMQGSHHQIRRGFFLFGAGAAFALTASGIVALPSTALLATRIAGGILSTIETGLFLVAAGAAARPVISYITGPTQPLLPFTVKDI